MDPGLVTSERPVWKSSHQADQLALPTITCRSCRVQIPVDAIEMHECDPDDLKALQSKKSVADITVTRANAFMESFLAADMDEKTKSANGDGAGPNTDRDSIRQAEVAPNAQYSTHSPLESPASSAPQSPTGSPQHISRIGRSVSSSYIVPTEATATNSLHPRQRSLSNVDHSLIQCRVRGVRVNKDQVAVYSIISNILNKKDAAVASAIGNTLMAALGSGNTVSTQEIIIERRYREFYAFALTVYSMFPSKELWQRLPPKTLCFLKSTKNDGFLLRRKNGLDDFIRCAIEMMDLGSSAQGTIGQWYLVRKFLNLPSTMLTQPTKDRSLVAATYELKKHARQTQGWNLASCLEEHDAIYEKTCDGFQMMKRVRQCPFPARAVFDMIVKNNQGNVTAPVSSAIQPTESIENGFNGNSFPTAASRSSNLVASWNPLVEHEEILRRDDGHTWVERTTFKGGWISPSMQMTSIKSWKVEDNGTIIVIMIPADDGDHDNQGNRVLHDFSRVDCIMGGWMITPTPKDETCTVTWLMQANFGECDPQSEFTGSQGLSALISRNVLLSWADEIVYLLSALEKSYSPSYYRHLGPLLSGGDFQKFKLERRDTTGSCVNEDPRVYALAHELEPCLCLLIHKSTNKNVLIFKTNLRSKSDLDSQVPIKAEWIMFEKNGNPRNDLSAIERSTTYHYTTRHIGPNVHHFRLELIRRDCVLRYDPHRGYALFTTVNGKPNTLLKRIYISYAKSSLLSFPKIEEVTLIADNELETLKLHTGK